MKIVLLTVMFLLLTNYAMADSGIKLTKESGGFLFEFGMSTKEPKSLGDVTMTLVLYNTTTGDLIIPDELRVKISKTDTPLFPPTSFKAQKDSVAMFRYTFPEGGNYRIEFTAKQEGKTGNATYEFFVERSENETMPNQIIMIAVVVAVILLIAPGFVKFVSDF